MNLKEIKKWQEKGKFCDWHESFTAEDIKNINWLIAEVERLQSSVTRLRDELPKKREPYEQGPIYRGENGITSYFKGGGVGESCHRLMDNE